MEKFQPDVVVAFGGGSPMDAAKMMRLLYERPETDFSNLAMRFMDIRKRVFPFPKLGEKASLVAVPTTAGTGSEVTPFAVITDERTGMKYPLADYQLTPDMAIVDPDLTMTSPKLLTACAGIDALSHALEAIASVMASDYTNGIGMEATRLIFEYLPAAYERGDDGVAREKMMNAATLSGVAFANAFLGICHSMSHALGARWHMPHGMANGLLLEEVIRFNSVDAPKKMGTFSQYGYPDCRRRYARVARMIGCKGERDEELVEGLISRLRALIKQVGLPASIREWIGEKGTEEAFKESVEEMSEEAFEDQCTIANPRYPSIEEIKAIYLQAYTGRV
jgi:acetaldehyde dehydrogenase/alcohol dehydrogenase